MYFSVLNFSQFRIKYRIQQLQLTLCSVSSAGTVLFPGIANVALKRPAVTFKCWKAILYELNPYKEYFYLLLSMFPLLMLVEEEEP